MGLEVVQSTNTEILGFARMTTCSAMNFRDGTLV